jgi:hypothetical protein
VQSLQPNQGPGGDTRPLSRKARPFRQPPAVAGDLPRPDRADSAAPTSTASASWSWRAGACRGHRSTGARR